jgi:hypothetical protein
MQSPFPRKQVGMLCKRFIGSGKHLIDNIRITQATLDTLQTNAGFIDYLRVACATEPCQTFE